MRIDMEDEHDGQTVKIWTHPFPDSNQGHKMLQTGLQDLLDEGWRLQHVVVKPGGMLGATLLHYLLKDEV
jgi:hypothetical protein